MGFMPLRQSILMELPVLLIGSLLVALGVWLRRDTLLLASSATFGVFFEEFLQRRYIGFLLLLAPIEIALLRSLAVVNNAQQLVAGWSIFNPVRSAIKAAFRAEKAGALVRLAKDVGRVGEKAGTRGALDTLRIAEGPKDVARAARLAESKGGQTRAILKLLGRGALLLAAGAFNLSLWVFSALLALFGFLSSIKATTERATEAWLRRKKARRLRKQAAACLPSTPALAGAVPQG